MRETRVQSLGWEGPLEKEMAPHSRTIAWKIPWTEKPGRLQSMGSQRVRHDWETSLFTIAVFSWRRQWHPTPVLLPGKSHGQRSLMGCSPWGCEESDRTERLHFHFSLSCIGEGNGNPLHCSCLENPRDAGAWWAAIYAVAQSRTWLKQLGSSSSIAVFSKYYDDDDIHNRVLKKQWSHGVVISSSFIAHLTINAPYTEKRNEILNICVTISLWKTFFKI